MSNLSRATKRSLSASSPRDSNDVSQVPRGTPPAWLARWQLASNLQDRLEMIYGNLGTNRRSMLRLVQTSHGYRELIQRYSNDSMP